MERKRRGDVSKAEDGELQSGWGGWRLGRWDLENLLGVPIFSVLAVPSTFRKFVFCSCGVMFVLLLARQRIFLQHRVK